MIKLATTILAVVLLAACSKADLQQAMGNQDTQRAWTEDVLLADGSTIVVKRTVTFKETNSLAGDAYNAVESDATLAFTGELAQLPAWRAPLMALLLYKDDTTNEWVLVAISNDCVQWNKLGAPRVMHLPNKPDTLYFEYRLKSSGWQEVPLSKSSAERPVNLLHRYQQELGTEHVSVPFRKRRESDPDIVKEYRRIEIYQINCSPWSTQRVLRAEMDRKAAELEQQAGE
jgi:hypothetical protein